MRARRLRGELFRLPERDDQLVLATVLCMTETQEALKGTDQATLGVTSADLFEWLREFAGEPDGHANVDYRWESVYEVQAALRRLRERRLLRGSRLDYESSSMMWRPTEAAAEYLSARRLFRDVA